MKILVFLSIVFALVTFDPTTFAQSPKIVEPLGSPIISFRDGDLVKPSISPDGKKIAYSRVVVTNAMELCEIVVRDISGMTSTVLMSAKESEKYAVYAAFVTRLEWVSATRIRAAVADGDVDSTLLTFDTTTKKIVGVAYEAAGESSPLSPRMKSVLPLLMKMSPTTKRTVFETALQPGNGAFLVGKNQLIFQHNYYQFPDHIQFADLRRQTIKPIVKIQDLVPAPTLLGGFGFGNVTYFIVDFGESIRIYSFDGTTARNVVDQPVDSTNGSGFRLSVKANTPERIVFAILPRSQVTKLRASLWIVDGRGLQSVKLPNDTIDIDIRGRLAAVTRHNLAVRQIDVFSFDFSSVPK